MKKKFLTLVVGTALCALAVGGVAQTSCGVKVYLIPVSNTSTYFGADSNNCGVFNGYISEKTSFQASTGSTIHVGIDRSTQFTVYTVSATSGSATLDCSAGANKCTWSTSSN